MTATVQKQPFVDDSKIGNQAASQPLSGVKTVEENGSVHGLSHVVRMPKTESVANSGK